MKIIRNLLLLLLIASMMFSVISCNMDNGNTPDTGGENNETPGEGGENNETPGEGGENNETPGEGGENNETPGEGGENNETPGEGGENNETPGEGGENNETPDVPEDPNAYSVTVKNPLGKPLAGITVFVHKEDGSDFNICTEPVITDENGRAEFTLDPTFTYSAQVMGLPEVYTVLSGETSADRYHFDKKHITVTAAPTERYTPKSYRTGDPMANFVITDINGKEYRLYDILSEKKLVVVNFWFATCPPCAAEFPALNTAYNTYKDTVEVLAVNDYPNNTENDVKSYSKNKGITLDMPLFKTQYGSAVSITRFPSNGYPTSIIIDRYGYISLIHVGAVTSVQSWNELFEYYTSDSYDGTKYGGF